MRVRCIDAGDSAFLIEGKEYDVKCDGKTTYIVEGSHTRFKKERFVDTTKEKL